MPPGEGLPPFAAWHHRGARDGFEVVFFHVRGAGLAVVGTTAAVEDDAPFSVRYEIELDDRWRTRSAHVCSHSLSGPREVTLKADGRGRWLVQGRAAEHLDGCLDVDLESSAMTNGFPVRRLAIAPGHAADAPAAYVRALDLSVERLDQCYVRVDEETGGQRYDYSSPTFDFRCELSFDAAGLVVDYPGIATRAALQS